MTRTVENYTAATEVVDLSEDVLRRANIMRDGCAGLLLILGSLLPWNIYFGIGIGETVGWALGLLMVVTLLALTALVLTHVRADAGHTSRSNTMRLMLTAPYFAVVAVFVGFTIVQSIRYGGTGMVAPGVGPGVWLGAAGAALAAQPAMGTTDSGQRTYGARISRIIGFVSLLLAVAAVLLNLYWRTRFVVPNLGDPDTGTQNAVVLIGAILYGVVALMPVLIVARWLIGDGQGFRLATVLLGSSAVVAGIFVAAVPVGRDLDAFHGIAQNTSTAGVGFEGYLAWTLAAAAVGTATVRGATAWDAASHWRGAIRKCLLLIGVWCAGTALLRIVDLMSASVLDLPAPPYNTTVLMAFDLLTALLAVWLLINSNTALGPKWLISLLFGVLFVATVARVLIGVALVPRSQPLNPTDINEVFGNTLTQQITSTFDVALCVLAAALLAAVLILDYRGSVKAPVTLRSQRQPTSPTEANAATDCPTEQYLPHTHGLGVAATDSAPSTVRIARPLSAPESANTAAEHVAEVLAQSTQRFAAGTTYEGPVNSGQ